MDTQSMGPPQRREWWAKRLVGVGLATIGKWLNMASMVRKQKFEELSFAIRPAKNGMSWSVFLVSGPGRSKEVSEFASEKAAQNWIDYMSKSWLKKRGSANRRGL
jgi:hypothetical protein